MGGKNLVEQHNEQMNGFDAGFDDTFGGNFDFGNNDDLDIAQANAETEATQASTAGFGGDWNTNFGADDDDVFGTNEPNEQPTQKTVEDVDHLFAASAADDLFGDATKEETTNANATPANDDLFAHTFGDDDVFGNNEEIKVEEKVNKNEDNVVVDDDDLFGGGNDGFDFDATANHDDVALFDDDDDDSFADEAIEFPEFDVNEVKPTSNKKATIKKKKKQELTPSPQPNQITSIPEPVISFDAPFDDNEDEQNDNLDDDNPFGDDAPISHDDGGDEDDDMFDGDNPFASAFDEPDNNNAQSTEVVDEFDPFG